MRRYRGRGTASSLPGTEVAIRASGNKAGAAGEAYESRQRQTKPCKAPDAIGASVHGEVTVRVVTGM